MWQVYGLLKSGLPKKEEEYLLHEIIKIMEGISTDDFKSVLNILKREKDILETPLDAALLFTTGLRSNGFFSFVEFVQGLTNGSSK